MATTLKLVEWIASGVNTTAGVAVASGKARFYAPGTLTPVDVYSDSAGAAAITQPLTLSAGGNGTVYTLDPVRCIVKDSLDVSTLWDVTLNIVRDDQIYVTSAAFNGGTETTLETILDNVSTSLGGTAGYWKYKESTDATERNLKDWIGELYVSIKDFGAVGDDATDNQTPITNAIARVGAAGKGTVFVPAGTFRHSSTITLSANVSIKGLGREKSILKCTGGAIRAMTIGTGAGSTFIEDIAITRASVVVGSEGLYADVAAHLSMNRVLVSGFERCVQANTTGGALISDVTTTTDATAVSEGISVNTPSTSTVVSGCTVTAGAGIGIYLFSGPTLVTGCHVISGGWGVAVSSPSGALDGVAVIGNRITATTTAVDVRASTSFEISDVSIVGNRLSATNGIVLARYTRRVHQYGNDFVTGYITDSRVDTPVAFILNGTTSVTPLPAKSDITKIVQGGGAAVTTINAPTGTFEFGKMHTVVCSNTSGGALTWTWNAAFKISAAVAPATGNRITLVFYRDPVDATWSEVSRSAAVPN